MEEIMPKKMKLNTTDFKVQSFVTSLNDDHKKKVVGGGTVTEWKLRCDPSCQATCMGSCYSCYNTCNWTCGADTRVPCDC